MHLINKLCENEDKMFNLNYNYCAIESLKNGWKLGKCYQTISMEYKFTYTNTLNTLQLVVGNANEPAFRLLAG